MVDATTPHEANTFWDKLVAFMDEQGLQMSGNAISFYVTRPRHTTATKADRAALESWLRQQPDVSAIEEWPLEDAWYGPFTWFDQTATFSQ